MDETREGRGRPIRFGIMCRDHRFAAWEAACIRHLLAVAGVEAAVLIVDDRAPDPPPARGQRLRELFDPRTLLWRLYQRVALNRRSQATQTVDLSAELAGVPMLRCRPKQFGKWVQRFQPEEVAAIREHRLDFIMRFAFNILRGDVLDAATHGVWSFHHDDPDKYRGQPPGFWEIYHRDPVIGVVLQRLTEKLDAGVMLHRGWFGADASSYARSRDAIFFGAADWPARLCRQMQRGEVPELAVPPHTGAAPIYRAPNSWQMLRFLWIQAGAIARKQVDSLFRVQQWSVGVIDAPLERVALDGGAAVRGARWLPEPRDRFLADPFATLDSAGRLAILAEDYDWRTGRGHVALVREGADGGFGAPEPAIRTDWHLSYPFLLRRDGDLYCVPEANESGEAAVYRARGDVADWARAGTLIADVPVVDPTLVEHDGRWWLFATRADEGANLKLYAWHGPAWNGPWTPHAANPLKTDIRSSRPAGAFFTKDGALYRPAQDCSTGYGAAVVVHRVTQLTPDAFAEEPVARIAPDPGGPFPTGLHTLSGAGGWTVIDGSRAAFLPTVFATAIGRKLRRLLPYPRRAAITSSKNAA